MLQMWKDHLGPCHHVMLALIICCTKSTCLISRTNSTSISQLNTSVGNLSQITTVTTTKQTSVAQVQVLKTSFLISTTTEMTFETRQSPDTNSTGQMEYLPLINKLFDMSQFQCNQTFFRNRFKLFGKIIFIWSRLCFVQSTTDAKRIRDPVDHTRRICWNGLLQSI